MSYYTLLCRDNAQSKWHIEFGDYDRNCVETERESLLYGSNWQKFSRNNLKIIKTKSARQSEINKAVAELNANLV